MNTELITDYEIYCGIDTLEITTPTVADDEIAKLPFVSSVWNKLAEGAKYKVNPDKANDNRCIYHYGLYSLTAEKMFAEMNIEQPRVTRIDFRFDRFDIPYVKLAKLNSALILMVARQYKCKNIYSAHDPLTLDELAVRMQTQYIEMEYYNKRKQEPKGQVESRLELRSKKLNGNDNEQEVLSKWFDRFDKAVTKDNYRLLQEYLNYSLIQKYEKEKAVNPYLQTNEFLFKYQDSIYTIKQLESFYNVLGYRKPKVSATAYKKRRNLETVNFKDLKEYISVLNESAERFFVS